jgi:hypothetical protein
MNENLINKIVELSLYTSMLDVHKLIEIGLDIKTIEKIMIKKIKMLSDFYKDEIQKVIEETREEICEVVGPDIMHIICEYIQFFDNAKVDRLTAENIKNIMI